MARLAVLGGGSARLPRSGAITGGVVAANGGFSVAAAANADANASLLSLLSVEFII